MTVNEYTVPSSNIRDLIVRNKDLDLLRTVRYSGIRRQVVRMKSKWVVEMVYMGKVEDVFRFKTREEAMACYESKLGACRYGLVGWSVSYPREVA